MESSKDCQALLEQMDEAWEVAHEAFSLVHEAMRDGIKHGYRGNWRGQSHVVHFGHAFRHVEELLGDLEADDALAHVQHAVCRLVMGVLNWYDAEISSHDSEGSTSPGSYEGVDSKQQYEHLCEVAGIDPRPDLPPLSEMRKGFTLSDLTSLPGRGEN